MMLCMFSFGAGKIIGLKQQVAVLPQYKLAISFAVHSKGEVSSAVASVDM